jgi:hypothetical protein
LVLLTIAAKACAMTNKIALLKEMDEALEKANHCSETLEKLLKQAKEVGRPEPELVDKISATNKQCDEEMQRYVSAYRNYYNISPK